MEERSFNDMLLAISEFSKTVLEGDVQKRDILEVFDDKLFLEMSNMGLYGLTVPEEKNGLGLNYYEYIKIIECIAEVDCSLALSIVFSNTLGLEPICTENSSEDLESLLYGEKYITGAITNNSKIYIINDINNLKYVNLFCSDGMVLNIKRAELDSLQPQLLTNKLGLRSLQISVINDVAIQTKNYKYTDSKNIILNFNLALASVALGACKGIYKKVKRYTGERILIRKPLNSYEANAFKLVDMAISIDSIENTLYNACLKKDNGLNYETAAMITKIIAMEKFKDISDNGIQLLGAYGLSREYDIERFYRDQKMIQLIWNSNNVDKKILSENILKEETK